jgi:hypothetical protein
MTQVLEGALRAKKPQAVGYGLLLEEVFKVIIAYVLITQFQQPFLGAITAIIIGFSVQTIYYLKLVSGDLNQKIQWSYVREWLKGSIANIYNLVGNQIAAFILILLFTYGDSEVGKIARGDYGAAVIISNVVAYSGGKKHKRCCHIYENGADVCDSYGCRCYGNTRFVSCNTRRGIRGSSANTCALGNGCARSNIIPILLKRAFRSGKAG